MPVRSVLPVAVAALALAAVGGCSSHDSSAAQVRPAQMARQSQCDQLLRAVEIELPTAIGSRIADAQSDVAEARELCNSGHPEEGIPLLRGVLNSLHENE
jgi:type IV pilus biogenesis protein CpaD/CtpE